MALYRVFGTVSTEAKAAGTRTMSRRAGIASVAVFGAAIVVILSLLVSRTERDVTTMSRW